MRSFRPLRRLVALVAVAAALSAAGVLAPAPASAFSTANGVRLDSVEARLAYLINNARTSRGIRALVVTPGTTDLARNWSMWQATHDTLQHNPGLVAGITTHGSPSWTRAAENVGRGATADSLFTAYMNSPGHRANILDPATTYLGIGWVERPDGIGYNTQVFVNQYTTTYGHNRVPAIGGLADNRTVSAATTVASFESGWDARALLARSGAGIAASALTFESPTTADQSVRFTAKETSVASGGGVEMRVRDALDLRNATGVRVKLWASTASGRAVSLQVGLRRELGTYVNAGRVSVPSGRWVTVTLPVPSGAKNFRNAFGVMVTRSALEALSSSLAGRSVTVRVSDITVLA
jgi:uncharacterized protein YkwD